SPAPAGPPTRPVTGDSRASADTRSSSRGFCFRRLGPASAPSPPAASRRVRASARGWARFSPVAPATATPKDSVMTTTTKTAEGRNINAAELAMCEAKGVDPDTYCRTRDAMRAQSGVYAEPTPMEELTDRWDRMSRDERIAAGAP